MTDIKKDIFQNSKCVIVLGMHRSGTSVLTHAVETLGAHLGSNLILPNKDNEKGYFENISIVRHNDKILKSLDCSWDSLSIPDLTHSQIHENSKPLSELISSEYKNIDFWGIKDPRLIRLNNIWQYVFKNLNITPYYVLANRKPLEVANSLYVRNKIPISISLLLWVQHQIDSLELILEYGGIVVNYDKMLSNPQYEIDRLANFLKIDAHLHEKKIECFVKQFVNKNLQHNKNNKEYPFFPGLDSLCNDIYKHLSQLATSPDNLIINKNQAHKSKNIISETRDFFIQNEDFILDISNIKSIYDEKTENLIDDYEDKITTLKTEVSILKSRLEWITNRPLYIFLKKIQKKVSYFS